jgi:hypothetical protein
MVYKENTCFSGVAHGGGAKMSAQVERQLVSYYAPHIAALRDVLGADYPE